MKNTGILKIKDLVQFSLLDPNLVRIKDHFFQSGNTSNLAKGLKVTIAATHAGMVNQNNVLYLPDRMREGATSFVSDYKKPILIHHDEEQDPIGRVISATYVDTSKSLLSDRFKNKVMKDRRGNSIGEMTEQLLADFVGDKMPFGQKVDVVRALFRDNVLQEAGFQGLGYIEIVAHITSPDAIQKFLDGRYHTGSVGLGTDRAVCSVCKTNWTDSEGPCDHKPGRFYDEMKCFLVAGNLKYDEYSMVNRPADVYSSVLQLNSVGLQDKIIETEGNSITEVRLSFPDYQSEELDDQMKLKDNQQDSNTSSVSNDVDKETNEVQEDKTQKDNVQESTDKQQDEFNFDSLMEGLLSDNPPELTDSQEEKLYELLWDEVKDLEKFQDFKDAKLSTEKRKSLPKSTFCGPSKSFPVPDCAHVTAAKRLINRYKGPGSKDTILACVDRKAKAMGCSTKDSELENVNDIKINDNMSHSRIMHMIISLIDEDKYYSGQEGPTLSDEEYSMLRTVLKRLAGLVGKDNLNKASTEERVAVSDTALLDEIVKLENSLGDIRERSTAMQQEYTNLFSDVESLQDQLVKEKSKNRKLLEEVVGLLSSLKDNKKVDNNGLMSLTDEVLNSQHVSLQESFDMNKIFEKLNSGMSRTPSGEVEAPDGIVLKTNDAMPSKEELQEMEQKYMELRMSKGKYAAEVYLNNAKAAWFQKQKSNNGGVK